MSFYDPFTQAMRQTSHRGRPTDRRTIARAHRLGYLGAQLNQGTALNQGTPLNQGAPLATMSNAGAAVELLTNPSGAQTAAQTISPDPVQTFTGGNVGASTVMGQQQPAPGPQASGGGGLGAFAAAGALLAAKLLHFF